MTAGHENGYDGHEGYDGMDALPAVLSGEPLPDAAHADAAFMAEHRAAAADVALLREQLGIIGDALAEPAPARKPAPAPAARPPRARRPRAARFAFGALAVAAVAAVLTGMAWLMTQSGGGVSADGASDSAAKSSDEKTGSGAVYMACARLVAEGDVTAVERVRGSGQRRVTLHVTRYYKPVNGKEELTFVTDGSVGPGPREGEHVLVGFSGRAPVPDRLGNG
ncbi:hypothetical protein [Streptomyces sp. NPDC058964]|uniref:hypothetical protein n=1 Tax=Streptomyces sp. NPDC058964 TaxID=3346681 RepID=UPI0036A8C3C2